MTGLDALVVTALVGLLALVLVVDTFATRRRRERERDRRSLLAAVRRYPEGDTP